MSSAKVSSAAIEDDRISSKTESILICPRDVFRLGNDWTDLDIVRWTEAFQYEFTQKEICKSRTRHEGKDEQSNIGSIASTLQEETNH